jgi:hypothetical protein
MGLMLMLSRSILTYTLFRGTRTLTKSGFDSIEGIYQIAKPSMCDDCGEVWGESPEKCPECTSSNMRKLYRNFELNTSFIDGDLDMNNIAA